MTKQFPSHWESVEFGDVTKIVGGGTPPSKDSGNFTACDGIPWLTPADLSGVRLQYIRRGARNLTEQGFAACSATKMPAGTVLFSSRAPIGYVAIAANEIATNQGFKSFVLPAGLESRYVYYYLRHIKPLAEQRATGTTFKELSGAAAAMLPLLIAPEGEQKRIADKLDTVLGRVDACRDRLDRVGPLLKRFRQSVLAAATSGSLTEDWRAARSATEQSTHPQGIVGDSEFEDVANVTSDIPDAWGWGRLALGITEASYGTASKSSKIGAMPVLRMGNLQGGKIDWVDLVYSNDDYDNRKYILAPGDVLFNRTNSPELVGKTAIYLGEQPAIYAGYLIRVKCSPAILNPKYANFCLNAPYGRAYCWAVKSDGVSQSNINAEKLRKFPVPYCEIEEQEEIVRRVEALFAFADRMEARLAQARIAADRLTPALLAKAFRGELVPQDPNDEPAAELLKRLHAARAEAQDGTKPRRYVTTGPAIATKGTNGGRRGERRMMTH